MCATWTQQDLSIALPQLPGAPWVWGALEMAVLLSVDAAASPPQHTRCVSQRIRP